ncbi:unnamed protein product [Zymoseptoria tritici ST99CH_3D7]|uniref:Ribosomal protein L1 n=1 Tax=Zymoseptoria tritici (strain ST99CH_3D7) TaxID=1276538 RepID=A0A1X7RJE2_ZYMT9|nr:unnamed protein product [Zymoseptoria tritici ST99CH_3D7]
MAPNQALTTTSKLDSAQTLRATSSLLRKIQSDALTSTTTAAKTSLLADADDTQVEDATPIWAILTTKKHIVDKKRLKPSKIVLPHPYLSVDEEGLRICLITADPQRKYKNLVDAENGFPADVADKVKRVIGMEKLKAKYKSYESKRQLFGEYDVFLADDRIITYLPGVLGKVFYKGGSKRPIPVSLEGKRQSVDEAGNKRRKLAEGGSKVVKDEIKPADVAREITRALGSALVHLAPSTTTAVKVGTAKQSAEEVQANLEAVVDGLVEKFVPQQWSNVRAVHVKGPETTALPIWLTEELWAQEADVHEKKAEVKEKKRKRGALVENGVIEVPGPDGEMRRLVKPEKGEKVKKDKKRKSEAIDDGAADDEAAKAAAKAEKAARKEALKMEKAAAKAAAAVNGGGVALDAEADEEEKKPKKKAKKSKA